MKVTLKPEKLAGTVDLPPSKSMLHRYMIAAAFADGESNISNFAFSKDIEATLGAIEALGARCSVKNGRLTVNGIKKVPECVTIDCNESGSTLRFLIPAALALTNRAKFTGSERLFERPLEPYFELFKERGIEVKRSKTGIEIKGKLEAGYFSLPGDISSQFISGLLFALPTLGGDSHIELKTPLESRGYALMTLEALREFGISVDSEENGFLVRGNGKYISKDLSVEPDFSQAAFFVAANSLGCEISMNLPENSLQGDREITDIAERLKNGGDIRIDASNIPDLIPAVAVISALRDGKHTSIINAGRLRIKESDRLESVRSFLSKMGANIHIAEDSIEIKGVKRLKGAHIDSFNDHRIAMAAAVAAVCADGDVVIEQAECVNKSYPAFWEDYKRLGGRICFG